jgi:hypothetical protein
MARPVARQALVGVAALLAATSVASARAPAIASTQLRLGRVVKLVGPTGAPQAVIAATSANGYEAFAWTRWAPPGLGGPHGWVQARLRLPDGRLMPTQSISASSGRAFLPVIGIDRAGMAIVAWLQQVRGRDFALEVSISAPGRRFSAPVVLGRTRVSGNEYLDENDLFGAGPALAVASGGAVVVAWRGATSMQAAVRRQGRCSARAAHACFSATQSLPQGVQPQIMFGARGVAFLVWAGLKGLCLLSPPCEPTARGIELAVAAADRRFGPPRQIAPVADTVSAPSLGLTPDGSATVAWDWSRSRAGGGIAVAVRDAAGAVSTPLKLSVPAGTVAPGEPGPPTVLVDPRGEALVDWVQADYSIAEVVRSAAGTFGPSQIIGRVLGNEPMAVDARGDTALAYEAGPYAEAFWSVRPPGGLFGSSILLPGSGSGPPFLIQRAENVITVGWTTRQGTYLGDIQIPAP